MMKVLIVGDKPSKYNTDPNIPFVGAKCEPRLREWLLQLGLSWNDCVFTNSHVLNCPELYDNRVPIIALGNKAYNNLISLFDSADISDFTFKLPHPSGLNRQINNKDFVFSRLADCKQFLHIYERHFTKDFQNTF